MVVDAVEAELDRVHARIAGRFARAEPRARAREYLLGLTAGLARANGWTLAEWAQEVSPDGMQRLLRSADWDVDGVRDDLRDHVVARFGEAGGALVLGDAGFAKRGDRSAGVHRQRRGADGRVENCQVGVFLAYSSARGRALVDRELHLPDPWVDDPVRRAAAGVPDRVGSATVARRGAEMVERALGAGVPFRWVAGGGEHGRDARLRVWLEQRDLPHVLVVDGDAPSVGADGGVTSAGELVDALPAGAWRRAGEGVWARVALRAPQRPGRARWLLARRDATGVTPHLCYGPRRATLLELVSAASACGHAEDCLRRADARAGLGQYQVRSWRAWHAHVTLSMLADAWLATCGAEAG
ncbi:IS701 family transposase [Actinosynnema pretiosum]|uniref:IS701 family transposase n=1 Tax=Actinosynnema pretiosum TaxID=42197 RepID=A0A290Z623_9PSEU|nr:IS701 family transposase [Actinosynnema pretiosum]ATE54487.1 IS701 family transposase [Actinosynnema pretiosum]